MYTDFFDFKAKPFELDPDLSFIYSGKANNEALATLIYAVEEREGWGLVLGEPGTGKTTLILQLLKELGDRIWPAVITDPKLPMMDFLNVLSLELGFEKPIIDKSEFILALRGLTTLCRKRGTTILIVIDDAQHLSNGMLQELLLLHRQDAGKPRVLNFILLGTPELGYRLSDPSLLSIKQSIRRACLLKPLSREESKAYILKRLKVAGGSPDIFTDDALEIIFKAAGGVPRVINSTCDTALLLAMGRDTKTVDAELAQIAAGGLKKNLLEEVKPPDKADHRQEQPRQPADYEDKGQSAGGGVTLADQADGQRPEEELGESADEPEPEQPAPTDAAIEEAAQEGLEGEESPIEQSRTGELDPADTTLVRNIVPPPPMEKAEKPFMRRAAMLAMILLLAGGYWLAQVYSPKILGLENRKATTIYIPPPIGDNEQAGGPSGNPSRTGR